jgi:hypothetical protein
VGSIYSRRNDPSQRYRFPSFWKLRKPLATGGFGGRRNTGDRAVDDGLFLFIQQRDHLPLRPDCFLDPSIRVIKEAHNCKLLLDRRDNNWNS